MAAVSEDILRIFEASRQKPGAPYDPERLLAFLTEPAAQRGRMVIDTFAGRRRLYRFMNALQLELGICFTNDEWERGFGFSQLTEKIEAKLGARISQVQMAKDRVREARNALTDGPIKFGILGAAALGLVGAMTRSPIGYAAAAGLWVVLVGVVVVLNAQEYANARRLLERVESGRRTSACT